MDGHGLGRVFAGSTDKYELIIHDLYIGVGTGGAVGALAPTSCKWGGGGGGGGGGAVPPQPKPCQDAILGLTMIHSMNIDSSRVYST